MSERLSGEASDVRLAEVMRSRANVYEVLSRCYEVEMSASFAARICREFEIEGGTAVMERELAAMRACLEGVDDAGIEMLAVTFDRVFFGMGPLTAKKAFPYESVYTSRKGLMMQDAYVDNVKLLRESRLEKRADFHEPEDHLAVQFAYMAVLAERAAVALDGGLQDVAEDDAVKQRAFLDEHMLNWIDRFAIDAVEAAEEGFYVHLARFTEEFVKWDAELLRDMLGESCDGGCSAEADGDAMGCGLS